MTNAELSCADKRCILCGAELCLRKQTISLALGNIENMYCLNCLAQQSESSAEEVLSGIKSYIQSRDCFRKQWDKYKDKNDCPDPHNCFPKSCFGSS